MKRKEKFILIICLILLIPTTIIALYIPQIIKVLLDNVDGEYYYYVLQLAVAIIFLIIMRTITKFITLKFGYSIITKLKNDFYDSLIYKRYNVDKIGRYIDIYDRDFTIVEKFLVVDCVNVVSNIIMMIGILIIFSRTSIILALFSMMFLITNLYILYMYVVKSNNSVVSETRNVEESYKNFVLEMFKLSKEFNGYKKISKVLEIISVQHIEIKKCNIKLHKYLYRLWIIVLLIYNFALGITLFIGIGLVGTNKISPNDFFVLFLYVLMLKNPLELIQNNFQSYIKFRESNMRINNVINQGINIIGDNITDINKIDFLNISKYINTKLILNNISCSLEPGVFCFYGQSGGGKSTFAKIISGVITDFDGTVHINDTLLASSDSLLRSSVYIERNTLDNGVFDELDINKYLLDEATNIVIIDEIYSNLTEDDAVNVVDNIRKHSENKIVIIISHYSYFIDLVDETFYFKGGCLIESN